MLALAAVIGRSSFLAGYCNNAGSLLKDATPTSELVGNPGCELV